MSCIKQIHAKFHMNTLHIHIYPAQAYGPEKLHTDFARSICEKVIHVRINRLQLHVANLLTVMH